jgi:membrane dipeptidase
VAGRSAAVGSATAGLRAARSVARVARRAWLPVMRLAAVVFASALCAAGGAAAGGAAADDAGVPGLLTLDSHVDIPFDFGDEGAAYDPMRPGPRGQQVHLPTMREGGLDAAFFIVYVGQGPRDDAGYARAASDAFRKFAAIHRMVARHAGTIGLARSAAEVRAIAASGRLVALIGVENGYPLGRDLRLLDVFHAFGARYMGLVHTRSNDLADASVSAIGPAPAGAAAAAPPGIAAAAPPGIAAAAPPGVAAEHGGLSALGRDAVVRLNELGIMVDVSHASDAAARQMLALSRAPVIASHSGVRGVHDHPRNLSDELLRGIAASGGVAQVVAFDSYLRPVPEAKQQALRALLAAFGLASAARVADLPPERRAAYDAQRDAIDARWPPAGVDDLVDHIDHAVRVAGIDHVGIASDFNGGGGIRGWSHAGETHNVTRALLARGYGADEVRRLWGGNLLRVMEACEAYAAGLRGAAPR